MKKFLKKRDNKGFSLVELIVVILIIAVLGVSLAPQVMKWVGTSKKSADTNNEAGIKSAVQAAVAEFVGAGGNISTTVSYEIASDGLHIKTTAANEPKVGTTLLSSYITGVMGGDYPSVQAESGKAFLITIEATTCKVTVAPTAATITVTPASSGT